MFYFLFVCFFDVVFVVDSFVVVIVVRNKHTKNIIRIGRLLGCVKIRFRIFATFWRKLS